MTEKFSSEDAKLTLYRDAPSWDNLKTAAIGEFSCKTPEAGTALLSNVAKQVQSDGFDAVVGPMDGDTWHKYRLITETDGSAPFLLEPGGKPHDLAAFQSAGFASISTYFSASVPLDQIDATIPAETTAFQVEAWDGTEPAALFAQVHDLSCTAFANNPFYKPIGIDAFLAMYMPVVPMLKREMILFARDADKALVGFLFGIPDYGEGPDPQSAILKTYASLRKGAGHALSSQFYHAAKTLGYQTAIHALMHDDNLSALRSDMKGAKVFRRYALMGCRFD